MNSSTTPSPSGESADAIAADVAGSDASSPPDRSGGIAGKLSFAIQFFGSLAIAGLVLAYFLFMPVPDGEDTEAVPRHREGVPQAIRVAGPRLIWINPESSLAAKLASEVAQLSRVTTAAVRVTGTVAASLRPIGPDAADQWQFNDPEALEAFYEWRRALIDMQFVEEQVQRMRDLNDTRLTARQTIVDRLRRLVAAGTDTAADLQQAEAELLEARIEGRKDIHEAESELRLATQQVAVEERQLQLMGLDVEMLQQASSDVDVVVAEVPEEYQRRVRIGQQSEARFFGLPGEVFPGTVQSISPTLSIERRALRVLFYVDDPDDKLRPGMFADIGLGTDPRDTVLVPATSVIHIGRDDFVFARVQDDPNHWRLVRVEVGDSQNATVEILAGLEPGTEIISEGAILLKPVAAASLRDETGLMKPVAAVSECESAGGER